MGDRSDDVGAVALGGMEKEELNGLDVSIFSRAPPEVMLQTLDWLRYTYVKTLQIRRDEGLQLWCAIMVAHHMQLCITSTCRTSRCALEFFRNCWTSKVEGFGKPTAKSVVQ